MELSIRNFVEARETVGQLLTELGLRNYRFDVEPAEEGWVVRLEYASETAWKQGTLRIDALSMERAARDDGRREVLERWGQQLRLRAGAVEPDGR